PCAPIDIFPQGLYRNWRPGELRTSPSGFVSAVWRLYRSRTQGRQAGGPAGRAGDEVRTGYQPPDCEDAWPYRVTDAARHGRRGDRMNRRAFITLVGGAAVAWPIAAHAQQGRVWRIGFLETIAEAENAPNMDAFRQGIRAHRYIERQNFVIEYRSA